MCKVSDAPPITHPTIRIEYSINGEKRMYSIYTLSDPRTEDVKYIGISCNVKARYAQHMSNHKETNPEKKAWIEELKEQHLHPALGILETIPEKDKALRREVYWIQIYARQGAMLVNMRDVELWADECWHFEQRKTKGHD